MFNFTISMKSFSNHFLISMPHMNDPVFAKTLIYMCEHNSEGSMGVIINKPMVFNNATDVLKQTGLRNIKPTPKIYFGGPINVDTGFILHDSNYKTEGTLLISESLALSSNKQIVADLKEGIGPIIFRLSFGYAGWIGGQIEREITNGDWLVMPANDDFIFSIPDQDKWNQAADQFGIDITNLGGAAGLA